MRVRSRDNLSTDTWNNNVVLGPKFAELGSTNFPRTDDLWVGSGALEYMEDVDGEFEDDNPCLHLVCTYSKLAQPFQLTLDKLGTNAGQILTATLHGVGGTNMFTTLGLLRSQHHPSNADLLEKWQVPSYSAEGWYSIYPVIKNELNLVNSIYELKDFKMLPKLIEKTRMTGRRLVSTLFSKAKNDKMRDLIRSFGFEEQYALSRGRVRLVPKYRKLSLAQLLKLVGSLSADHFLNWKFAVQPLLNDIMATTDVALNLHRNVARLLARADGSIQKGHYSKQLRPDEVGLDAGQLVGSNWGGSGAGYYRIVNSVKSPPEYRLSVRYSYGYSEEARKLAYELGRLDALGLNVNSAILWRAKAWSFIVDWFIKIGPMMDRLQPKHLEPVVHIHGGCESIKYSYESAQEMYPYGDFIGFNPQIAWGGCVPQINAKVTNDVYVRKRCIPSLLGMPKTSDFSTMEKLLALALLASAGGYKTG